MIINSEVAFFKENGYLILKNVFETSELDAFKKSLETLVQHACRSKNMPYHNLDQGLIELSRQSQVWVSRIQRTISRSPDFFRLSSHPLLNDTLRQLLNREPHSPLYHLNNGVIFTCPRTAGLPISHMNVEVGWHKDTFFTIPKSRYLHFWFPVIHPANREIGTLRICRGSHRAGIAKHVFCPENSFDNRYMAAPSEVTRYEQMDMEINLGDVLLLDGHTWHASGINQSDKVRCTVIGLCHDPLYEDFKPVAGTYIFDEYTPEEYFHDLFGDERILLQTSQKLNPPDESNPSDQW